MSNVTQTPDPIDTQPPVNTATPTVHDLAAARMLTEIQAMMEAIRGFSFTSALHRRRITPYLTVPTEFLLAVAVALDASPTLRIAAGITGTELREKLSFCNAYAPVGDDMKLKGDGLLQSVRSERAGANQLALKVYRVAKGLNAPADVELLVPHLANMKRTLGRGRRKAAADAGDPTAQAKAKAEAKAKAGGA